jgi:CBS domain-containing protein
MICPWCDENNLPGADACGNCLQDLTHLDRPVPRDRIERSLMDDKVSLIRLRRLIVVSPDTTVGEAIVALLAGDVGAVPVVDAAGHLVGIFTERDLLMKVVGVHDDFASHPVRDHMTRRPESVRESDSLAFALHTMDCGDYRHLPVLRDGRLLGVLSVRDLTQHITRMCKLVVQ